MRTVAVKRIDPSSLPEYVPRIGWYVYYLWLGTELVYVGKTTNMDKRIAAHINSSKRFDRVTYTTLGSKQAMHALERSEIKRHQARYNISGLSKEAYWAARGAR